MKFLITEIALYLAAAGVLGLIVGWLMKASGAKRRIKALNASSEAKLKTMETEKNSVISALTGEKETLQSQNTQLAADTKHAASSLAQVEHKRVAVTTELEKNKAVLEKTQAQASMLGAKVESQQETMRKARIEIEQLATQQDELQVKLASIRESKDREITSLEKQLKAFAGHSTIHSAATAAVATGATATTEEASRRAQLEREAREQQAAADELNTRIDSLAHEREQLMREREAVINRTRQFESTLQQDSPEKDRQEINSPESSDSFIQSLDTVEPLDKTVTMADAPQRDQHRFRDTAAVESELDQSMEIDEPHELFDDAGLQSVIEESTSPATEFDPGLSSYDRFDESFDNVQPSDSTQDAGTVKQGYSDPLRDRLSTAKEPDNRPTLWDRVRSTVSKSDNKN